MNSVIRSRLCKKSLPPADFMCASLTWPYHAISSTIPEVGSPRRPELFAVLMPIDATVEDFRPWVEAREFFFHGALDRFEIFAIKELRPLDPLQKLETVGFSHFVFQAYPRPPRTLQEVGLWFPKAENFKWFFLPRGISDRFVRCYAAFLRNLPYSQVEVELTTVDRGPRAYRIATTVRALVRSIIFQLTL
jgi:hypothetical protein